MQKQPETLQLELPETGIEEKKQPLNEAEQYSTWMAIEKGKLVYALILHKVYVAGQLDHYNVLRLFDSEITEVAPELFSEMIADGRVKRWTL